MKIEKTILANIDGCYAVSIMETNGKPRAFFATEFDGECFSADIPNFQNRVNIWDTPGGCMGMVPIPGRDGEFIAIQKFYRLWDWEEAQLVWVRPEASGGYTVTPIITLPYVHRFDFLVRDGVVYLIACTVAAHKTSLQDWSVPGCVYAAELPADLENGVNMQIIYDGLFQNHGYARIDWNGHEAGLVSCRNGMFVFTPPSKAKHSWEIEQIMQQPTSDADMIDIDGDGEPEFATIEAFHGDRYRIYKKINGSYQAVWEHPERADFYHVVKAVTIAGKPAFLGGARGGAKALFVVQYDPNNCGFCTTVLDEGTGPSNAAAFELPGMDLVFSANREEGCAAVYKLTP